MTSMYKISSGKIENVNRSSLSSENILEGWIAENPRLINLDVLVIGTQIITDFDGRIDILAINREGDLTVIELKRDKTPRDVVAQTLDYASWVSSLNTNQIHELFLGETGKNLEDSFLEYFGTAIPESLNENHNMVIVSSQYDASSRRIVEYLAEKHSISINSVFFSVFQDGAETYLTTDWQLDQQEVTKRSESKTKAPWSGYWYVNAGHGSHRSWEDMRKYGFIAAGGGRKYSKSLDRLKIGDPIFVYEKDYGYIGYGQVTTEAKIAKDFDVEGKPLLSYQLEQPNLCHDQNDPELADYVVGVKWHKTFPLTDSKFFKGVFANQHIVCKLRDQATVEFLKSTFDVKTDS